MNRFWCYTHFKNKITLHPSFLILTGSLFSSSLVSPSFFSSILRLSGGKTKQKPSAIDFLKRLEMGISWKIGISDEKKNTLTIYFHSDLMEQETSRAGTWDWRAGRFHGPFQRSCDLQQRLAHHPRASLLNEWINKMAKGHWHQTMMLSLAYKIHSFS